VFVKVRHIQRGNKNNWHVNAPSDIAAKYLSTEDRASLPRILQFSSEDKYTKYEICELFAEIMGLSLVNMKANNEGNDPKASVQRPYDCHLSTKALKDIGIEVFTQNFKDWWRRECRAYRKWNTGAKTASKAAKGSVSILVNSVCVELQLLTSQLKLVDEWYTNQGISRHTNSNDQILNRINALISSRRYNLTRRWLACNMWHKIHMERC
jgi:hypothetical protein